MQNLAVLVLFSRDYFEVSATDAILTEFLPYINVTELPSTISNLAIMTSFLPTRCSK
jgi:hypothetical protein